MPSATSRSLENYVGGRGMAEEAALCMETWEKWNCSQVERSQHAADFPNTDAQKVDVTDRPDERRKQFLDGNPKSDGSSFELHLNMGSV